MTPRYVPAGRAQIRTCAYSGSRAAHALDRTEPVPLHNLPAAQQLERLTAEYLLGQLTEAATDSLAAENGARFATMESAHDDVSRKRESPHLQASHARQEEVTAELLEAQQMLQPHRRLHMRLDRFAHHRPQLLGAPRCATHDTGSDASGRAVRRLRAEHTG